MARNHRLDGLRGIAAMVVLIHHSVHVCNTTLVETVLAPNLQDLPLSSLPGRALLSTAAGGVAVYLFFILSGCVLIASLEKEGTFGPDVAMRFIGRRILRIYPATIIAVVAFWILSNFWLPARQGEPFSVSDMLWNVSLIKDPVNGGTWTLQTEMLMVPFILIVAWFRSILGTIAIVVFLFWAETCLFYGSPVQPILLSVALPAFALGMLIPTEIAREAFQKFHPIAPAALLALLVGERAYFSIHSNIGLIVLLTTGFLLVAALAHGKATKSIFESAPLLFLGRISFSLYLLHVMVVAGLYPAIAYFFGADQISQHYIVFGLGIAVVAAGITIPLSSLCEKYIEAPFIRLSYMAFSRRVIQPAE